MADAHRLLQNSHDVNFDLSRDGQRVDPLQRQSIFVVQHVRAVDRHLEATAVALIKLSNG